MRLRTRIALTLALAVGCLLWAPAVTAQDSFPEDAGSAMRVYEDEWPIEDWADGPVQYLLLRHERDIWKKLTSDQERREFVAWFWNRRDPDPRDEVSPLRQEFYTRVAYSNQRFSGFPRGWRSDRGRVYIILGPPTGGMRRVSQGFGGRCQGYQGELWTFRTMGMAFSASMGEFFVLFIETRANTYEVCDPVMLGAGGYPAELSRALEITQDAWVLDDVTEFEPGRGAALRERAATDVVASTRPLTVLQWPDAGAAGHVVVPVEIQLRDLFFEPVEDRLVASLRATAVLTPVGAGADLRGSRDWTIDLDAATASGIGSSVLRTAIVVPVEPGGWAVSVSIVDPLSSVAYTWQGAVEVNAEGPIATSPLVGRLERLREGGEVAVISAREPFVAVGEQFSLVSWVRGMQPQADDVALLLIAADGSETAVPVDAAAWGGAAAGPLVVQGTVPPLPPGSYVLRLQVVGLPAADAGLQIR